METEMPKCSSLQDKTIKTRRPLWYISTSLLCDGLFLAGQIVEGSVYYHVHAAHKQGFYFPSDQFY